ncbi:tyrosine-type recombinase/integrase [Chloroflexota bacterium]
MDTTANIDHDILEPAVRALHQLSPQSQETAVALIRRLAETEGITVMSTSAPGLQSPAEGVPLWVAKLKAERYSPRTIHMYRYLAGRYLDKDPEPTRLGMQSYLAKRLEEVSPALVSNERKALASLFRFLHGEGLWPVNPLNGVGHVRVRYRERLCPDIGDVIRVMEAGCARRRDTDKLRTLVLLLATTGIRATEAAGILKGNIDTEALELRVTGKGDKARVVPLLPRTAEALGSYMRRRRSSSPYLFPGDTSTGHMSIHNLEKTLRRMCLRLGVRPFTPHQLRHLYATTMLKGGAKLEVVSRILGHTGVGVTADIYRHVATEELHEEHARFAPLNGSMALLEG